jgi:hypothetical protein
VYAKKRKMKVLIIPYHGMSTQLSKAMEFYNCLPKKVECKGNSCPIVKPFNIMTSDEVKNNIVNTLKNNVNVKEIHVLALNEQDQFTFVEMSRSGNWGSMKKGVTIKIILYK